MAITIFGRGYPLSAEADDTKLTIAWNGNTVMEFSGSTTEIPTLCASTIHATTFSGDTTTSGGKTSLVFTVNPGTKTCCAYGALGATTSVSADALLCATWGSTALYIPCFSGFHKSS